MGAPPASLPSALARRRHRSSTVDRVPVSDRQLSDVTPPPSAARRHISDVTPPARRRAPALRPTARQLSELTGPSSNDSLPSPPPLPLPLASLVDAFAADPDDEPESPQLTPAARRLPDSPQLTLPKSPAHAFPAVRSFGPRRPPTGFESTRSLGPRHTSEIESASSPAFPPTRSFGERTMPKESPSTSPSRVLLPRKRASEPPQLRLPKAAAVARASDALPPRRASSVTPEETARLAGALHAQGSYALAAETRANTKRNGGRSRVVARVLRAVRRIRAIKLAATAATALEAGLSSHGGSPAGAKAVHRVRFADELTYLRIVPAGPMGRTKLEAEDLPMPPDKPGGGRMEPRRLGRRETGVGPRPPPRPAGASPSPRVQTPRAGGGRACRAYSDVGPATPQGRKIGFGSSPKVPSPTSIMSAR